MTRQSLPNRRFRRLLPAALAGVALAGASVAGPAAAKADVQRAAHAAPPSNAISVAPGDAVTRHPTRQPHSAN
jgi:hypothetical protein